VSGLTPGSSPPPQVVDEGVKRLSPRQAARRRRTRRGAPLRAQRSHLFEERRQVATCAERLGDNPVSSRPLGSDGV